MRVAFLGRGKLGMNVLTRLLDDSRIEVPVIITCKSTPEVEYPEEAFKEIATKNNIKFIKTKKPKKKIQYIQVTAVFLLLLNATNSGSSILEISCFPFTG